MRRFLIAVAALAVSSSAAYAGCSTAALQGNWVIIVPEGICTATVAKNGTVSGGCGPGKLALNAGCRLTGSLYGYKVVGRTDNQAGTKLKPMIFVADAAKAVGVMAYRK